MFGQRSKTKKKRRRGEEHIMTQDEVQMLVSSLPGQVIVINDMLECKFSALPSGEVYAFTRFVQDPNSHNTSNSCASVDVKDLTTGKHMKGMVFLQKHDDLKSYSAMLYVKPYSIAGDMLFSSSSEQWTSSFTVVSVESKKEDA